MTSSSSFFFFVFLPSAPVSAVDDDGDSELGMGSLSNPLPPGLPECYPYFEEDQSYVERRWRKMRMLFYPRCNKEDKLLVEWWDDITGLWGFNRVRSQFRPTTVLYRARL